MRTTFARIALALSLAIGLGAGEAGSAAADGPAAPAPGGGGAPATATVLPLRKAVEQGLIQARGFEPAGYRSIQLELANAGSEALDVDLCGSFLTPTGTRSCQRLGLGPVITPGSEPRRRPGAVVVTVPAGGTWSARVATVCLDVSKACPTDQTFRPSTAPLPPAREKVMRWWADHPETAQHDVNSAIWRNADEVDAGPSDTPTSGPPPLRGTVRGATTYLVRDGALLARDPDGVERFLATRIVDVFPVAGALYAVAEVGSAHELWRYVETGDEPWQRVVAVLEDLELVSIEPAAGGGLLATSPTELLRLVPGDAAFRTLFALPAGATELSYRTVSGGRVRVGLTLPRSEGVFKGGEQELAQAPRPELWSVDLAGGRPAERVKTFWNVAGIAQGPAGAFALTNAGHLRVLTGESFRDQRGPDGLAQILHVGREHLWARTRGDGLVCVRVATGAAVEAQLRWSGLQHVRFDDVSADAVGVLGGDLVRVSAADGGLTTLERAARPAPAVESAPGAVPR